MRGWHADFPRISTYHALGIEAGSVYGFLKFDAIKRRASHQLDGPDSLDALGRRCSVASF